MGPWLRMSAWLPPGLALGWLAVLGTFVRGVGNLLAAWAATVSLVVLLARRRPARSSNGPPGSTSSTMPSGAGSPPATGPPPVGASADAPRVPDVDERTAAGGTSSKPAPVDADPEPADPAERRRPTATPQPILIEVVPTVGLQVLTAAEVASVLRVDADVIVTAISNGEFPGNRIGSQWRVDQGSLARWLQGAYRFVPDPVSPSPSGHRT